MKYEVVYNLYDSFLN